MDNLSKCMIQCKKDGFGVHYGAWRAAQGMVLVVQDNGIPEGFMKCQYCGKLFKPYNKRAQKYCEAYCQRRASFERCKQKKREVDAGFGGGGQRD